MSLDSLWVRLGGFGFHQRKVFVFLCLVGLPFSFIDTGPVFWADTPNIYCGMKGKDKWSENHTVFHNAASSCNYKKDSNHSGHCENGTNSTTKWKTRENITIDDIYDFINSTAFNDTARLLNSTHYTLGYEDVLVLNNIGYKCSFSSNEGLITLRNGNTTRQCQYSVSNNKGSTIVTRVSCIYH